MRALRGKIKKVGRGAGDLLWRSPKRALSVIHMQQQRDRAKSGPAVILRAYPEISGAPVAPSNFAPDESDLTGTLCMVRKIDEVWHIIANKPW